jgi:hypothetical protein
MTDPRETDSDAYYRADSGRDKSDTRRADETLRRGEIAPFRMEVRADTHFTYLFMLGAGNLAYSPPRAQLGLGKPKLELTCATPVLQRR